MNDDKVDRLIVGVMVSAMDDFIGSCIDEHGNPKAPDRASLMRARGMLPPSCKNTLSKPKQTGKATEC